MLDALLISSSDLDTRCPPGIFSLEIACCSVNNIQDEVFNILCEYLGDVASLQRAKDARCALESDVQVRLDLSMLVHP